MQVLIANASVQSPSLQHSFYATQKQQQQHQQQPPPQQQQQQQQQQQWPAPAGSSWVLPAPHQAPHPSSQERLLPNRQNMTEGAGLGPSNARTVPLAVKVEPQPWQAHQQLPWQLQLLEQLRQQQQQQQLEVTPKAAASLNHPAFKPAN